MEQYRGRLVTYSQNKEDILLWGLFHSLGEPGFYIDVGANHPLEDSVTKFFYLRGWRGINIDPQTQCYKMLQEDRPDDINLCIGVSDSNGTAKFTSFDNTGISTFNKEVSEIYPEEFEKTTSKVKVRTLKRVIDEYIPKGRDIHFLKIDVEGHEAEVLKGNNWQKNRPWVVMIEQTWKPSEWTSILRSNGYNLYAFDGLNAIYIADERRELLLSTSTVFSNSETIRYNDALSQSRVFIFILLANTLAKLFGRLNKLLKKP